ncbi:hypothetical protein P7K49_017933 [Saguinus oedipus]|uniref:Uncharacterized protein n=1 Tax=Saguinus oedipus TaxID=9490 RepID=A0ABQ9V6M4_SAGOE|nr:hypothetical protein P7K49_017933 [Saguinus oedipus]
MVQCHTPASFRAQCYDRLHSSREACVFTRAVVPSVPLESTSPSLLTTDNALERSFFIRMKSTLTKRGVHIKSSGYKVQIINTCDFEEPIGVLVIFPSQGRGFLTPLLLTADIAGVLKAPI